METSCNICGGRHLTGACQENRDKQPYDFSYPIPNFQYWNTDPSKLPERLERHETMKKGMLRRMESDLIPSIEQEPQIDADGRVQYIVAGSYTFLLAGVADRMELMKLQPDLTLTVSDEPINLRAETTRSIGILPGDVDIVQITDKNLNFSKIDLFDVNQEISRVVKYTVGNHEILSRHPIEQFCESWARITGVFGPGQQLGNISETKSKIIRYDSILKSLLQSVSIEEIAKQIVEIFMNYRTSYHGSEILFTNPERMKQYLEKKGTEYEFEMDAEHYSAILMLMKTIKEIMQTYNTIDTTI